VGQRRLDGHVAGEILVFGTEAVDGPGTHARAGEGAGASECLEEGGAVVDALADHRLDEAEVVDPIANVREEVADLVAALSAGAELPLGLHQRARRVLVVERERALDGQRIAVVLEQIRLVVERVDGRRAAVHEEEDDVLGARREVRLDGGERILRGGGGAVPGQQPGEG